MAIMKRTLILLVVALLCYGVESILVMRFQEDGIAMNSTMAEYPTPMDRSRRLDSVTLCARFKIFFLHPRGTFFRLLDKATGRDSMLRGELWVERVRPAFAHRWNFQLLKKKLWAFRWYHLCFIYDHISHLILTYLDGELSNEQVYDIEQQMYGDYLHLGQGDDATESFSGELTQVNAWDKVLSADEIRRIANCETDLTGNYVSWTVDWILRDISTYDLPLQYLCSQEVDVTYFWFPYLPVADAQYICEALGTHLPVVRTQEDVDFYHRIATETFPDTTDCRRKLWAPLDDLTDEGIWRYTYNEEVATDVLWGVGEPNGLVYENCAVVNLDGLHDVDCKTNIRCAFCMSKEQKRFSFLGICEAELRNIYFVAYKNGEENLIFKGYGKYHIRFDDGAWVWVDVVDNITIARMEMTVPHYPMGRRPWMLEREVCGQPAGGRRPLLLTPCSEEHFTCDDASCIPFEGRCDLRYDCKDKSDETGCKPIAFPKDYQQHLPPRPNEEEDTSLPIYVDTIIEALAVKTLLMTTEVTYTVRMTWKENRVDYLNAKQNNTLNILSYSTFKDLWTPMVSFVNTEGNLHTEVDKEAQMFVNRLQGPNKRDEAAPEEVEVFFGDFNTISIQRKYTTVFSCIFNLELYPFDDQQCEMHFSITSAPRNFLYFKQANSTVSFSQIPKLLEYEVGELSLKVDNTGFYSDARIIIPLSRRPGYAILNIYTPSLVMLIVSYVTLFFRPAIFDVRMISALTAQLVIATFFSQVSSALPKTSYFKMVDVWLLFCIGITFLVIILHAVVDTVINDPYYKDSGSSSMFNNVQKISPQPMKVGSERSLTAEPQDRGHKLVLATKVIILTLFVVFNVAYWGYILS